MGEKSPYGHSKKDATKRMASPDSDKSHKSKPEYSARTVTSPDRSSNKS